jgi:hypothetical protein
MSLTSGAYQESRQRYLLGLGPFTLEISQIHWSTGALRGRITLLKPDEEPDAQGQDALKAVFQTEMDLGLMRDRESLIRILRPFEEEDSTSSDETSPFEPWAPHIHELFVDIAYQEAAREMPKRICDIPKPDGNRFLTVAGFPLLTSDVSILFGDGGTGKSLLTLYWMALFANRGHRVLWLDYEMGAWDHQERLGTLFSTQVGGLLHLAGNAPVAALEETLRQHIVNERIDFMVIDSAMLASPGKDNTPAAMPTELFQTLRRLALGVMIIGHQTKDGSDEKPFGCHSADTDVLTDQGWLPHADVTPTHSIACFNHHTSEIEWARPSVVHQYLFNGTLIEMAGVSTNFCVTPTHRVLVKTPQGEGRWARDWRIHLASKLNGTSIRVPGAALDPNGTDSPRPGFAEFLGWWIAEGSLDGNAPVLTQRQGPLATRMQAVVQQLGFSANAWFGKSRPTEQTCMQLRLRKATVLGHWLRDHAGSGAYHKHIPRECFHWTLKDRQTLLSALMEGDGSWRSPQAGVYTTMSAQLADDVQQLAIQNGWTATIATSPRNGNPTFDIRIGRRTFFELRGARHWHVRPYTGMVYCLTVPTGAYITRRQGKASITGNSAFWHNNVRASWHIQQRGNGFLQLTCRKNTFGDGVKEGETITYNILRNKEKTHTTITNTESETLKESTAEAILKCLSMLSPEHPGRTFSELLSGLSGVKNATLTKVLERLRKSGKVTRDTQTGHYRTVD